MISQTTYIERIHLVVDYISEHLSEEITLETLSEVACFSPFHFHRIFTAITGETPRDYIERTKLERAATQLCVMRGKSVSAIAFDYGFSSISTFSRAFKKHYGFSPSVFLQKHKDDFHSLNVAKELRTPMVTEEELLSVKIVRLPAFHVVYAQSLDGYPSGIPRAWNRLLPFCHNHNLINENTRLIGIPYDNPGITPREKCRYRACVPAPDQLVFTRGEIKTTNLEEATYAIYHFKGRREDITNAYALMYGAWLLQSGYIPDEKPSLEIYPLTMISDRVQDTLEYDIALPVVPM